MCYFRRNSMRWLKFSLAVSSMLSVLYCAFVWKLHNEAASLNSKQWKKEYPRASALVGEKSHDEEALSDVHHANIPALQPQLPASGLEPVGLRDYHNYSLMAMEAEQQGPGEQGGAYHLPASLRKERDELYHVNGFNARASDDIALNRSLKDIRHHKCQSLQYPGQLPTVSVVVPFHNEHLSTLLRTAISAVNRSPHHLLLEVLLVDDASTKLRYAITSKSTTDGRASQRTFLLNLDSDAESTYLPSAFLGSSLDAYLAAKVSVARVVRLKQREGLIRARLAGAREARGEVLVFLDSHTECTSNWLPPLLEPISRDYRTAVCPFIDVIDYETFEYRAQDEGARGGFDWDLYYKRLPLTEQDKASMPQPFRSPVMAGGLFAISRRFFWELGGYDPGLQIWGGEQYELSFKVWQCGGTMLDAPCSRVGHVYRKYAPFPNPGVGDYLGKNYKRVAEVWMDEFAEFVYLHRPHYRRLDAGDLTEQRALRARLQCKSFKWFIKEIAFDLIGVYPPVEPPNFASGTLSPALSPALCVDGGHHSHGDRVTLKRCGGGGEQKMVFTWHKDIRPGGRGICLDVSSNDVRSPVTLYTCHGMGGNQLWRYRPSSQRVEHGGNSRCLDHDPVSEELFVAACSAADTQRWAVEKVDQARLAHWDEDGYTLPPDR